MSFERFFKRVSADEEPWNDYSYGRGAFVLMARCEQLIERHRELSLTRRRWNEFLHRLFGWSEYILYSDEFDIERRRSFLTTMVQILVIARDATRDDANGISYLLWQNIVRGEPSANPFTATNRQEKLRKYAPIRDAIFETMATQLLLPDQWHQECALFGLSDVRDWERRRALIASLRGTFANDEVAERAEAAYEGLLY